MLRVETLTPMLPSLRRQRYELAVVGGGVGAASTIAQLAQYYKAFCLGEEIPVGEGGKLISFEGTPIPPSFSISVFDPQERIGRGMAFREIHPDVRLDTNTPLSQNGLFPYGSNHFADFGWGKSDLNKPPNRVCQGNFNAWQLESTLGLMGDFHLPFELKSVSANVVDIGVTTDGEFKKFTLDWGFGFTGEYDGLLVATGHSENPVFKGWANSPNLIRNVYLEYDRLKSWVQDKEQTIVIAGMGDTAREALVQLKREGFAGELILVASGTKTAVITAILEGMGGLCSDQYSRYLNELHSAGRLRFIDGRVTEYGEIECKGRVIVEPSEAGQEKIQILAPLILGAPFLDKPDEYGFSPSDIVRCLQEKGYIGFLTDRGGVYTDEGGIAKGYDRNASPPVFLAGRVALGIAQNTIHQTAIHAEGVAWGILQHAYQVAWQEANDSSQPPKPG